ncbi:hypothetical protein [Bradyrhizobium sp. STM 3557]|uniref:hypothetical protein n=1 Tax=Bradyrhizobium sp. STM 3557 TaxID=578920 RepID=UPI00388F719C
MVCRALGFAAVLLLVSGGLARPVQAQENLDAGKSPSQLFAGTCSACHKSPRGLLKTIPAGSLQGFLRQHYTTGPDMAGVLAGYLVSNGANDTRATGGKSSRDGRSETRSDAKPDTEAAPVERTGRRHRRSATEPAGEAAPAPEAAAGADAPPKPHTRHKSARHKRGRPAGDDAAKPDAVNEEPSEAARPVAGEKPAAESRAEAPRTDAPKESEPTLRAEPAPSAAPTITQSIPSTSSAGAADPSVPTAPAER